LIEAFEDDGLGMSS